MGEAKVSEDEEYKVVVSLNKEKKTLKFSDNGIGMTEEEVKKYINQVAFSGATDFMEKYKDKIKIHIDKNFFIIMLLIINHVTYILHIVQNLIRQQIKLFFYNNITSSRFPSFSKNT